MNSVSPTSTELLYDVKLIVRNTYSSVRVVTRVERSVDVVLRSRRVLSVEISRVSHLTCLYVDPMFSCAFYGIKCSQTHEKSPKEYRFAAKTRKHVLSAE